jgi:hypothetical protein
MLKTQKKSPKVSEKIRALVEFDQRFKSAKEFLQMSNYWRNFYLDATPIYPKPKGQLTCIENIIEMAYESHLNLNILIGVTHKAFIKRRFNPNFTEVLARGIDYYESLYDQVVADTDRAEYEEEALR